MDIFENLLRHHPDLVGELIDHGDDKMHFTVKGKTKKGYMNFRKYMDGHISVLTSLVDEHNYATPITTGFPEVFRSTQQMSLQDHVNSDREFACALKTLCLLADHRFNKHPTTVLADYLFIKSPGSVMIDDLVGILDPNYEDFDTQVYISQGTGLNPYIEI